jgi:hypothetical protein
MKTPQGIKSWRLSIDYPVKLANVRIVHGRLFMLLHVEGESALELSLNITGGGSTLSQK